MENFFASSCTFHRGRLSKHYLHIDVRWNLSLLVNIDASAMCVFIHIISIYAKIFTNTALMIGMERRKQTKLCE